MKKILSSIVLILMATFCLAQPFTNELNIPSTLSGTDFILNCQTGTTEFIPGVQSATYGYNGSLLGPTLIFQQNDSLNITVNNNVGETVTLHWHGMHVPAKFDGGPHNEIEDGQSWSPTFKVYEEASTMWYHSHLHHNTLRQVNKGLAGMIIIKDDNEATLDLPRTYGVDDFPIIIQDRSFDSTGVLIDHVVLGDTVMTNGTLSPYVECPAQMVRFRLLNASAQRIYNIGMSDDRNFSIIAGDAGLIAEPYDTNRIVISPGERVEIVVDFSGENGDSLQLLTYASELELGHPGGPFLIADDHFPSAINGIDLPFLQMNIVAATASPVTSISTTLNNIVPLDTSLAVRERYKKLSGTLDNSGNRVWTINDRAYSMMRIDDIVVDGDIEVWELDNSSAITHPFHIHAGHFYIVSRNGVAPPPYERGKKDVVYVRGGEKVKFAMKFEDFPDEEHLYMYHCHLLNHEDHGMMAQFLMVDSSYFTSATTSLINDESLVVSPNPVKDLLDVSLDAQDEHIEQIILLDIQGKMVKEWNFSSMTLQEQIDMSVYDIGTYFVLVNTERGMRIMKVIKN
ncbi:MAG: multicopper oxidase domain-containing protein [Chitinophagales bacterium]